MEEMVSVPKKLLNNLIVYLGAQQPIKSYLELLQIASKTDKETGPQVREPDTKE